MHSLSPATTLAAVLLDAACAPSSNPLVTVQRDGSETRSSYAELLARSRGLLAALQAQGLTQGQTVLSQLGAGSRQLELFWACVLGGMVPVLLPKVASWRRESEASRRLHGVCELLGQAVVLVDEEQRVDYASGVADIPGGQRWICDPGQGVAALALTHNAAPEDLAYLQFSSGSTGVPKGVRLTHANLLANLRDIAQANQLTPQDGFLNWMPYYHDMGLVMFHLVPCLLGAAQVKLDAADFVAQPLRWLHKIHEHRSVVVGGPNFGLRHVLEAMQGRAPEGVDLSCVRRWLNGAEPIWAPTLREFCSLMASVGLRPEAMAPAYGLAEAAVAVSFSPLNEAPVVHRLDRQALLRDGLVRDATEGVEAIDYVDLGLPLPSAQVRIASEDGLELGENRLGEVQIRGASVSAGYETLDQGAVLAPLAPEGWLRTGDLGFLRQGRLTITGRLKDVIFIHGRKVMAADVEQHLSQTFGLKSGRIAACGVPQADGSEAVALFVVAHAREADWQRLHGLRAEAENYLAHPVAAVVPVRRIPHTSSGKLQRHPLARKWQHGEFDTLLQDFRAHGPQRAADSADSADSDAVVQAVVQAWAAALRLRPSEIGLDSAFTALGGSSLDAIRMCTLLEQALKRRLDLKLLVECRTVRDFVAAIQHEQPEPRPNPAPALHSAPAPQQPPMPIAVIGMACRFPGAATPDEFWRHLRDGVCSIREYPAPAWMPEGERLHAGRIDGIEQFAADFFGIDDEEARLMDPQQRLMLELAYEALDDAGYGGARMPAQRRLGVYTGANHNGYLELINQLRHQSGFAGERHSQLLPGNLMNVIAARVSQRLDFKGPALTVDAACASSLVALHYACADLRAGLCEIALAGGSSLATHVDVIQYMQQTGSMSGGGSVRVFDEAADGLVYSEGLGLVVLKPLDKALADGDRIDGVIRATAINNDGRSLGVMAPTPEGQEALLREALARAGLQPSQIGYIEAHGTGTPVGDAVEVRALTNVFGEASERAYCGLGSVKSNIGHPMSAAGIAGLIKLLLCLRHELLPPTLNLRNPHPNLLQEHTPFWLVRSATPWPRSDTPRHAGINSFGFGGANAHAIVSDAPLPAPRAPSGRTHHLLCLSARNAEELLAVRSRLLGHLLQRPELSMLDLSYTCCAGRAAFKLRECMVVSSVQDAVDQLRYGRRELAGGAPAAAAALAEQGRRWVRGEALDWLEHFRDSGARIVPLPTYPFTRRPYWLPGESPQARAIAPRAGAAAHSSSARAIAPCAPVASFAPMASAQAPHTLAAQAVQPWLEPHTPPRTVPMAAAAQAAATAPSPLDRLEDKVAGWIEAELLAQDLKGKDRATPFSAMGADSLNAGQTCQALATRLGVPVPMALFFEHGSVERLARHLTRLHGPVIERLLRETNGPAVAATHEAAPSQRQRR